MNILTNAMNKVYRTLSQTDAKLKEYGKEPYGVTKLTPKEQRERFENMTMPEFMALLEEHGEEEVNEAIRKSRKEGSNG